MSGVPSGTAQTDLVAWEASLYLAYEFDIGKNMIISPYGGLLVNGVSVDIGGIANPEQNDLFGVLFGVEAGVNVALYIEGRFISQISVAAGLSFKF